MERSRVEETAEAGRVRGSVGLEKKYKEGGDRVHGTEGGQEVTGKRRAVM